MYFNELSLGRRNFRHVFKESTKVHAKINSQTWFENFCNKSTIAGFSYFTRHVFHYSERVFLCVWFLTICSLLSYFIHVIFGRYLEEAAYKYIDPNYWDDVGFPSDMKNAPNVAVCPEKLLDDALFPSIFKKYEIEDTNDTRSLFRFLAIANYGNLDKLPRSYIRKSQYLQKVLLELVDYSLVNAPEMNKQNVKLIFTEIGLCFTFKGQYSKSSRTNKKNFYEVEDSYNDHDVNKIKDPRKTLSPNELLISHIHSRIRSIALYENQAVPAMVDALSLESNRADIVQFSILETVAEQEYHDLDIKQRGMCMFPDDRKLKYWPYYKQKLCMTECRMNKSIELCGCVPHFATTLFPTDGDERICTYPGLYCLSRNKNRIFEMTPSRCNCLPDCQSVRYFVISVLEAGTYFGLMENRSLAVSAIKIRSFPAFALKRGVRFNLVGFLLNLGGLTGLCLGASVLSFVEILMFLVLKPIVRYFR